jgi:hypothetical protein
MPIIPGEQRQALAKHPVCPVDRADDEGTPTVIASFGQTPQGQPNGRYGVESPSDGWCLTYQWAGRNAMQNSMIAFWEVWVWWDRATAEVGYGR